MTAALIFAAIAGGAVAKVNFDEIRRDPDTKGWGVGIGSLAFIVFGSLAVFGG